MNLLIRADASPDIGSGHVMRCLALAKACQNAGGGVTCVMAESICALEERLVGEGIALRKITAVPGTTSDAEQTVAEARRANASWIVADGYRFEPDYVRSLKAARLHVLFLDDDGRFDSYPADVVLNQNISANPALYEKREPFTRLLLGPDYVLLRREFVGEARAHENPKVARKVLVTMGGGDPDNVAAKVMHALSHIGRDIKVRVVIGSGNEWEKELESLVGQLPLKVQLERNPENMAPLMSWADVAISGAGGTTWELAYLGVPSIVIALSRDQRAIAQGLAEREIAISLGWHANLSNERISDTLKSLLDDYDRRLAMSERGRKLVDGRGAERVVKFLQSSL